MDQTYGLVFKILGMSSAARKKFFLSRIPVPGMCKMYRNNDRIPVLYCILYDMPPIINLDYLVADYPNGS